MAVLARRLAASRVTLGGSFAMHMLSYALRQFSKSRYILLSVEAFIAINHLLDRKPGESGTLRMGWSFCAAFLGCVLRCFGCRQCSLGRWDLSRWMMLSMIFLPNLGYSWVFGGNMNTPSPWVDGYDKGRGPYLPAEYPGDMHSQRLMVQNRPLCLP